MLRAAHQHGSLMIALPAVAGVCLFADPFMHVFFYAFFPHRI